MHAADATDLGAVDPDFGAAHDVPGVRERAEVMDGRAAETSDTGVLQRCAGQQNDGAEHNGAGTR